MTAKTARSRCSRPLPKSILDKLCKRGLITDRAAALRCPPKWGSPIDLKAVPGSYFDVDAVEKVVEAFRGLRHTKARWAGRVFEPDPWQVLWILAPVFGWKHADGTRVIRTVWIEIPRKNGKSALSSGLGIVLLTADGEIGAEVYAAATSRDQAGIVHEEAKKMIRRSPRLGKAVANKRIELLAGVIKVPRTGSIFRAISKLADVAHGLNVSAAIVDEVHVHRRRELIDAIETGTGARSQPLVVLITTADEGDDTTIYAEKHKDVVSQAEQTTEYDPSLYGVIWAADEKADPLDEATWESCNPGLDITISREYLRKEAKKARRNPSYLPTFCRLHLNRRIREKPRWIQLERWDRGGGLISYEGLKGRAGYGGLDLGSVEDFTSWTVVLPGTVRTVDDNDEPVERDGFDIWQRFWIPEGALDRRPELAPTFQAWAEEGWLEITDGDATDYDVVETRIGEDAEHLELVEFAYDPWQAENLRQRLVDGGLKGWKCPQSMAHMAEPSKQLEHLVLNHALNHGGNPVLRWMVSNAIAKRDANGNVKPDRAHSPEKIDGVVTLVMAIAAATREREAAPPAPAAAASGGEDLFRPTGRLDI